MKYNLAQINAFSSEVFVNVLGGTFEKSPWVAESTWSQRPFADLSDLHKALCETVQNAGEEKQVELIRSHPDLVGHAALDGALTPESTREQASAGLGRLLPEEIVLFQNNNKAYWDKFRFPFVICARLNKKEAILDGFKKRQTHSREEEIQTALEEISKIAYLRLQDIIAP